MVLSLPHCVTVCERKNCQKKKADGAEEIINSSTVSHHKSKPTWKICILGPLLRTPLKEGCLSDCSCVRVFFVCCRWLRDIFEVGQRKINGEQMEESQVGIPDENVPYCSQQDVGCLPGAIFIREDFRRGVAVSCHPAEELWLPPWYAHHACSVFLWSPPS